ncbi:hypothetical protein VTJ04DRAFT_8797 [Mycothermus thermophilus]|uniref:uncharacterized protein n=1 Tax=Humicola insolens TaxID=85995 RepID=UPI0037428E27
MGSAGVEPGVQQEQQQQKQQARAATVELGKMDDDDGCGRGSGDGAQAWPRPGADLDEARGARGQKEHAEEAKAEDGLVNGDGAPRSTFSKLRHSFPHGGPPPPTDIDADLLSRDKARNKEAIKRYLAEKVRNDWEFTWPPPDASAAANKGTSPVNGNGTSETNGASADQDQDPPRDPGEEADDESDAESVYSTISEDPAHFRPRLDWTSDLSDSDEPPQPLSPYRFDSPDAVGAAVNSAIEAKRARRRRAIREEAKWNPGLACFEARRDAWTGARTVRMKPKPPSPVSPSSPRRLFWRHHRTQSTPAPVSPASPPSSDSPLQQQAAGRNSTTTATSESDPTGGSQRTASSDSTAPHVLYPVHTVLPIPPPLLPPQNPIRASIQPSMYASLYDKVVLQGLQPACPINLSDMLRACVVGWKRDGEWPPRPSYPVPPPMPSYSVEISAARQRKAQRQRAKDAAKAAKEAAGTSPPSGTTHGRRLSLVGLFGGGGGSSAAKASAPPPAPEQAKDGKENSNNAPAQGQQSGSHSDEAPVSGKALFRRSLQRVLSLGQHGHGHSTAPAAAAAAGNGNANVSPTTPTTTTAAKEVAAAS